MNAASQPTARARESAAPPGPAPRKRVLLIGPLPNAGDVVGGTKVSFEQLVTHVRAAGRFELEVLDSARPRAGRGRLARALADLRACAGVLAGLLAPRRHFDAVLLCVSSGGALLAGPLVWLACRLRGAPLALRLFGGDLDGFYERSGRLRRWLARSTWLRSPLVLLQTRALCERFGDVSGARWFPTTRDLPRSYAPRSPARAERPGGARRFLFVGQLRPEKGAGLALEAVESLPADARLDVYGPAMPGFDPAPFERSARATWHGPLAPERVPAALAAADALVFPTWHAGEGLPGIVLEALQCGLPVVASRFRALPELLTDGVDGLLVAPRDPGELRTALRRLYDDGELLESLRMGALETGNGFRSSVWNARLEDWVAALCEGEAA